MMCPTHWIPTVDHKCPACDRCPTCGGVGELEGRPGEPSRVDCPECTKPRVILQVVQAMIADGLEPAWVEMIARLAREYGTVYRFLIRWQVARDPNERAEIVSDLIDLASDL